MAIFHSFSNIHLFINIAINIREKEREIQNTLYFNQNYSEGNITVHELVER